jgi:hypothetical protein
LGAQASYDTSFATVETDEPGLAQVDPQGFPSVWYRLSPGRGGVELHAEVEPTSLFGDEPKRLSVYTGTSLGALTLVARAETFLFPSSSPFDSTVDLSFSTVAGQEYFVQVLSTSAFRSGFDPGIGGGTLSTTFHPAPANDDFADAAPLGAQASYDTSFATVEADEPGLAQVDPQGFPSVWYRLSPGLGTVALGAEGVPALPGKPRQLAVYTGPNLASLTSVARSSTPDPFPGAVGDPIDPALDLEFPTSCGATYFVQLLGPSAFPHLGQSTFERTVGVGELTRQFQPTPPPTNDAFADAATLGLGRTTLPPNWWTCVSAEAGEPAHGGAPAARSVWYRTTVASGRVTVDSPGNRVAVYQGTSLATLTPVADGSSGQATFLTEGGTYLVAVDGVSGTTVDLSLTPGDVRITTTGFFTTDNELPPDGATPSDPIETTLSGPAGSRKTIFETQGTTAPTAWTFLGWKVEISAPPSPTNPYTITFLIDASLLSSSPGPVAIFRNGVAVPNCVSLQPDPCVQSNLPAIGGDRRIVIRTSQASDWTFGIPRTTRGTALGLLQPSSGGDAEFLVASNGTTVAGAFSYGIGSERFVAITVNALAIHGSTAWLAGVGLDRRPFLAYVEDNGPGSSDRFRLWIGGVEQTDLDGALHLGNITIRP